MLVTVKLDQKCVHMFSIVLLQSSWNQGWNLKKRPVRGQSFIPYRDNHAARVKQIKFFFHFAVPVR